MGETRNVEAPVCLRAADSACPAGNCDSSQDRFPVPRERPDVATTLGTIYVVQHDAFERLYAEHAGPLLAFLTYRTGDAVLAEDLLADTFERVLRARRRFDPRRGSQKAWLYTIALNL